MKPPKPTIQPAEGASLVLNLLDLAADGDLDLSDLEIADIEALHTVLAEILAVRLAPD